MARGTIIDDRQGDGFKARMRVLIDRGRRLARDYVRRPERRVRGTRASTEPGAYARPVTVKVVYHDRARGAFPNTVAALANYLAKEGELFDRDRQGIAAQEIAAQEIAAQEIAEAWSNDRRVFHVIVSPNDGHRIDDMVSYGRDVVAAWEARAGRLEWVAAVETKPDMAHPDGNKHLHVMLRGVRDDHDLFFERDVISRGFRQDAVDAATDRLGWMDERERRAYERQLVEMQRLREERGWDRGGRDEPGGREL